MARVSTDDLVALQRTPNVRNMCILAHVDHGKTTLSDLLVASNGIISDRMAGKMRYLDSMEDEQKRGITMRASAISLIFQHHPRGKLLRGGGSGGGGGGNGGGGSGGGGDGGIPHMVNLIDSPGHIDFSSDVGTATRLCDGALIVVDVVEGVCVQTVAVLRQAWAERIKPCLVLNKIDRLAIELHLDPAETCQRLRRTVERINAISAALISNLLVEKDLRGDFDGAENESTREELEAAWQFSPEKGNVVFASATDGWAFQIADFARMWAAKIGAKPKVLREYLWGDFAYNSSTEKVVKLKGDGPSDQNPCMFVSLILRPIWQIYEASVLDPNAKKTKRMASKLGIELSDHEMRQHAADPRALGRAVFRRWLPLARSVLTMAVEHMPSPAEAQPNRLPALCYCEPEAARSADALPPPPPVAELGSSRMPSEAELRDTAARRIQEAVAKCDQSESAPMVAFVSKMVAVPTKELRLLGGPLGSVWQPPSWGKALGDGGGSGDGGAEESHDTPEEILVGFTRVFSGVLRASDDDAPADSSTAASGIPFSSSRSQRPLFALGPKHNPALVELEKSKDGVRIANSSPHVAAITEAAARILDGSTPLFAPGNSSSPNEPPRPGTPRRCPFALYIMMGDALVPVASVPAGSVCAVAGIAEQVAKCATLVSSDFVAPLVGSSDGGDAGGPFLGPLCLPIRATGHQARPMLRVAVEAERGMRDAAALDAGLRMLHQADPAVEISVQRSGEQVIAALGELHLEQCLKDLEERYARVPLRVSPPLLAFREGLEALPEADTMLETEAGADITAGGSSPPAPGLDAQAEPRGGARDESWFDWETPSLGLLAPQLRTVPWSSDEGAPFVLRVPMASSSANSQADGTKSGGEVGVGRARVPAADGTIAVTVRCRSLMASTAQILDEASPEALSSVPLHVPLRSLRPASAIAALNAAREASSSTSAPLKSLSYEDMLRARLAAHAAQGNGSEILVAFGPRSSGPNMLLRSGAPSFAVRAHSSVEDLCSFLATDPCARRNVIRGPLATILRSGPSSEDGNALSEGESQGVTTSQQNFETLSNEDAEDVWRTVVQSVDSGFQLATAAGPLSEEPVYGVAFVVEAIDVVTLEEAPKEVQGDAVSAMPPQGRQPMQLLKTNMFALNVTKATRIACRSALLSNPMLRLIEGFYKCDLQCDQGQLGSLYAVLSKRRGIVLQDELVEGTELFLISAHLPVVESGGFSSELLEKTSGAATSPLLSFSHWACISMSPFWRPTTEDERDEFGEAYASHDANRTGNLSRRHIDAVRRRKGLMVEEKVVVAAEKQRTLTKMK